jgi:hypothetical protein
MIRFKIAAIALVLALTLFLQGCYTAKYEFDFVEEEDYVNAQGSWFADGEGELPPGFGIWTRDARLSAPYFFAGDFSCSFEFYCNYITTTIDWMDFLLVNDMWQDAVPLEKFFGLSIHRYATVPEYSVWQGAVTFDIQNTDLAPPGLVNNAVNTVKITRNGNTVRVYMNGTLLGTLTIEPENDTTYWCPAFHGEYSGSYPGGFYIRKLTILYSRGSELEAPWAF